VTPAIVPNNVPTANKQGSTGTKFFLCTGAFTAGNVVSVDANGNCVDSGGTGGGGGSGLTVYSGLAGITISGGVTAYFPFGGGNNASTTESDVTVNLRSAATVSKFTSHLSAALGGPGNTVVFTVRKNAGDTTITCTITDPAVECSDTTHSVSFASGDTIDVKAVFVGTIAATPVFVLGAIVGATSTPAFTPDILSEAKSGGTLNSAKVEGVSVAASATTTLLNITPGSAGYISHMFIAFTNSDAAARTSSTLKITVDGEAAGGTFNSRIPLYFGAEYCYNTVNYSSRWNGCQQNNSNNIGFYSYIPIPFATSVLIELVNGSATTASTVWANFTYQTGVANTWPNTRKLRTASGTLTNQTVNTVVSLVDVSGINRGRLAGTYMSIDSFPNTANPPTAPLEGNVKIYIDGAGSPNLESSGTEDFFNWSNYFEGSNTLYGPLSANNNYSYDQGYTGVQFSTVPGTVQTWNVYRYHIMDQVLFTNALKVTWNCGDSTQVNFTGGVRVAWMIWYYTE
jgi:hypothetical protein